MVVTNSSDSMDGMLDDLSKEELKALIKRLAWNEGFGCFYRSGFEHIVWPVIREKAEWGILLDIDGLHALNAKHDSFDPVDALIKDALSITRSTDIKAGMLKSGDEIVIIMLKDKRNDKVSDPDGLVGRLVKSFGKHHMSATYAIVPIVSSDLSVNFEPAVKKIKEIKSQRSSPR